MGSVGGSGTVVPRVSRLLGAPAMACVLAFTAIAPDLSFAQGDPLAPQIDPNAQMYLESDTLVYDNDRRTVTAEGGVRIDYAGNRVVADRVVYDQATRRLVARGNVEVIDTDGNKIYSDEIDVTDDFRDGFVNALVVETPDKTYFGADSAERREGNETTFNRGVYTACAPCEENPEKAPIWRVKARKIIWDGKEKVVRFRDARFEFFGLPIAYLPYFSAPDPTVKRKSGFLMPGINYKSELGVGVSVPYYVALAPTYDLLLSPRYYAQQGFLGHAEFRQQYDSGQYNIQVAGIRQNDPAAFTAGTVDAVETDRFMIASKGDFRINPMWSFGWDVLAQSDRNFSRTYSIGSYGDYVETSQLYLIGLNDRNYFDLRAYKFHVQETYYDPAYARDEKQPFVLPSFDYTKTIDEPVLGGELRFDVNAQGLDRERLDTSVGTATGVNPPGIDVNEVFRLRGVEGQTARITTEAEWRRQLIAPGGLVITPVLQARADSISVDYSQASIDAINNMSNALGVAADIRSSYFRSMATAGLEVRWPILFSTTSSVHVLEPMAQVFARPNAPYSDALGIPNEDAQSFVFDATSLFERDKFSGYDRIEGGTRANVGVRYSGSYSNGWSTNAIFGQSYHLAGDNPYASPDLVNAGAFSGLESDRSDFVGLIGVAAPSTLELSVGGRFDEETFEMRRGEVNARAYSSLGSVYSRYAFIQAQPLYGFLDDRRELTLGGRAKVHQNWDVFGESTYDFESDQIVRNSVGFSYDDECFTYNMTYSEIRPTSAGSEVSRSIGFMLSFRTLGDFGTDTSTVSQ